MENTPLLGETHLQLAPLRVKNLKKIVFTSAGICLLVLLLVWQTRTYNYEENIALNAAGGTLTLIQYQN